MTTSRLERWRRNGGPRLSRVVVVTAVMTVMLVVAGVALVVQSVEAYSRAEAQISGRIDPAVDATDTVLASFIDEETGTRGELISGREEFLQPFTAAQPVLAANVRRLQALTAGHVAERTELEAVLAAHGEWRSAAADPEQADVRSGLLAQARALEASGVGRAAFDALRQAVSRLSLTLRGERQAADARLRHDQSVVLIVGTTVLGLVALLIVAFYLLLWRGVLQPLGRLARGAENASTTGLDRALPAAGPPEIRGVGRSVERMRSELVEQLRRSREATEALRSRGQAVLALQAELTPHVGPVPGLAVAAKLQPAEGLLAGDWYDQVQLQDGRVAFVLGDVSGHGASAGAYALGLSRTLRSALAAGMTPSQALAHVGSLLDDDPDDERFASVFVAIVDVGAGSGTYASAGHPDTLLFGADGSVRRLGATGPLLAGIVAGPYAWSTAAFSLPSESLLLAVTDGVLEARDRGGDEYGVERLVREVLGLTAAAAGWAGGSPEVLLEQLFRQVELFTRGLSADDRTALAVVRHAGTLAPDVRPMQLR